MDPDFLAVFIGKFSKSNLLRAHKLGEARMAPSNRSTIRDDLMRDHVPYEIWMMRGTHDGLIHGGASQVVCWNACIESFAIHARSLINFFNGKDGLRAADFTDNYVPFVSGKVPRRLTEKLNQQIPHITERRFNTVAEKFNLDDIRELRLLIDAEVTRFLLHMQPRYCAMWDEKKGHLRARSTP